MKIQLDTEKKTIKIEEPVNLGEFIKTLEKMLPNKLWKDFSLEVTTIVNWVNPIVIEPYVQPFNPINPYPVQPMPMPSPNPTHPNWPLPWIICDTNTSNVSLNKGTFNIQF